MLRALLPNHGKGYKLILKPLAQGQTMTAMIGYITKDQGKPHYKILVHNISAQVLIILIDNGNLILIFIPLGANQWKKRA